MKKKLTKQQTQTPERSKQEKMEKSPQLKGTLQKLQESNFKKIYKHLENSIDKIQTKLLSTHSF